MAKISKQKAQKEYICSKCDRTISKGEIYKKIIESYNVKKNVCIDCYVSRSELTKSEYLSWLYEMQDGFSIYIPDDVQELIDCLEEEKNILEVELEKLSKQTKKSLLMKERIDNLDSTIYELEQIQFEEDDTEEEIEYKLEDARQYLNALI